MSVDSLRLCVIADPNSPTTGRWLKYFVECGHEVHLITISESRSVWEGVTYHHLLLPIFRSAKRWKKWIALLHLPRLRRLIEGIQPDLLHAHYLNLYGWLGGLSGFHPFVISLWGSDVHFAYHGRQGWISKYLSPFALNNADLVTSASKFLAESARQQIARFNADCQVVYVLPDLRLFYPGCQSNVWRQRLKLEGCRVIFSPRWLRPIYNIETIVKAMPQVLSQIPEARLVLNTKYPPGDETYATEIKEMIRSRRLDYAIIPIDEVGVSLKE